MAYVCLSMYHRREIIHYRGAILPENGKCKVGNSTYINHFYPKITLKTPKKSCKIILYKKKLSLTFTDPDHYMYTKCWK